MATEVIKIVDPDNGSGTDYTSLAAAIAGEARNLVTADEQLTIKCRCTGGTADGAVTIDGFTTDATRYVKVWTDPSESYRWCDSSRGAARCTYPASGNYYRIEGSLTTGDLVCLRDNHLRLIGLAVKLTVPSGGANAIRAYLSGGTFYIDKCYILGDCTGTGSAYGYYDYSNNSFNYITNTIVSGFISASNPADLNFTGIRCGYGSVYAYNCTVFNCGNGINGTSNSDTFNVVNCAVFNCSVDDIGNTYVDLVDYCATDDAEGTNNVQWLNGATDWANVFNDYANGDFSLRDYTGAGKIIGMGTDDPGSGLYSDDILGNARTSPWDIGAFEYVSAGGGTTYDESISLSGSGSMAPFHALSIASAVNINAAAEQVNSTAISIISSLSMNANADNDLSPSANMLGGLMLATECGFSPSVVASLLSALDLKSAAALSPVGTLALTAATALSASAGLEAISSVGASTYGVALSLDAQAAIEQAAVNAIAATFGASAVAGIDAIPDYEIAAALSLQVDADIQRVCSMAAQAMLSMGVGAEHIPSATAAFNASMALGVDAILQAITQSALPGSVAARVSRVLAENRIVRVSRENRIIRA